MPLQTTAYRIKFLFECVWNFSCVFHSTLFSIRLMTLTALIEFSLTMICFKCVFDATASTPIAFWPPASAIIYNRTYPLMSARIVWLQMIKEC